MPVLQEHLGGYDHREFVTLLGSFRFNSTGPALDVLRDGNTKAFSVAITSPGLYTVTILGKQPIPKRCVLERTWINPPTGVAAKVSKADIVDGSYNQVTRTFQIVVTTVADVALAAYTDPAVEHPTTLSRIGFELQGSISSAGTDLA